MKYTKTIHLFAILFILLTATLFFSAWTDPNLDDHMAFVVIISFIVLTIGYVRPCLPRWVRRPIVLVFLYVACAPDQHIPLGFLYISLFSWTVTVRRFVMQGLEKQD